MSTISSINTAQILPAQSVSPSKTSTSTLQTSTGVKTDLSAEPSSDTVALTEAAQARTKSNTLLIAKTGALSVNTSDNTPPAPTNEASNTNDSQVKALQGSLSIKQGTLLKASSNPPIVLSLFK